MCQVLSLFILFYGLYSTCVYQVCQLYYFLIEITIKYIHTCRLV